MTDTLTPQQRHRNMAAIHSKGTKPEMIVRRHLWTHGFRYRLNHTRLPGKPDIVLRKYRTCIFVNGCFWHGHEACDFFRMPKTNTGFWQKKINRNRERDKEVRLKLAVMGWRTITVWECQLRPGEREKTLQSLVYILSRGFLADHNVKMYEEDDNEEQMMVAEDSTTYSPGHCQQKQE